MMSDTRTAEDIERDIEDERAQLSGTINELHKKFSIEGVISDVKAMVRDQGGDIGRAVTTTVGRNPAAVALIGVGVAWLVLGKGRANGSMRRDRGAAYGRSWEGTMPSAYRDDDAWYDDGGAVYGETAPSTRYDTASQGEGVMSKLRSGAEAVVGAVSDAAGTVKDKAMDLTEKLSAGTEGLSEEAKARVLAARRAAHDARDAAKQALAKSTRAMSNMFEDHPLVVGALAVAAGAAVGGMLPRTRIEDDALGANSDRLFAEAQAIFREERDKAMSAVKSAADDAGSAFRSASDDMADRAEAGMGDYGPSTGRTDEFAGRMGDEDENAGPNANRNP